MINCNENKMIVKKKSNEQDINSSGRKKRDKYREYSML